MNELWVAFLGKNKTLSSMILTIHTDGWSRWNPGPSGCAFVVSQKNTIIETGKFFLWTMTNNQAEYIWAILGLETAKKLGGTEIHLIMDSELIIKQLQWIYKVKDPWMKILHKKVRSITTWFSSITFTAVLRDKNKHADELANQAMDDRFPLFDTSTLLDTPHTLFHE